MVSDSPPDDQLAERPPATLIPVQVDHVDQLVLVARDLDGFLLILMPQPPATQRSLPWNVF